MPKFTLANDLWIGCVPHKLSILTLPKQLCIDISSLSPLLYCIIKLYPCNGHVSNPNHLQHSMVENVMLYNVNMDAICDMLEGQLLLQPAMQLASVLAITHIGSKKLLKSWLKSTF